MTWEIFIVAVFSGLIGGGALAAIGYRALKDRLIGDLKEVFARKSELDGMGGRMGAFENILIMTRDRADANSDDIIRLQEQQRPLSSLLERLIERQDDHDRSIQRTAALLDEISRRLDRERNDNQRR